MLCFDRDVICDRFGCQYLCAETTAKCNFPGSVSDIGLAEISEIQIDRSRSDYLYPSLDRSLAAMNEASVAFMVI